MLTTLIKRLPFLFLAVLLIYLFLEWESRHTPITDLYSIPQNALSFVTQKNTAHLKPSTEKNLLDNYLRNYFSPWDDTVLNEKTKLAKLSLSSFINSNMSSQFWGENYQPYEKIWLPKLMKTTNLISIGTVNRKAITINATDERLLPTNEPAYHDVHLAGEGYPFDYLQNYHWPANTPLRVIGYSTNKAWAYAISPASAGWYKLNSIAYVDEPFIQQWHSQHFITPLVDHIPIFDTNGTYRFDTRIGAIFPETADNTSSYSVSIAVANTDQTAGIKTAQLQKSVAVQMPLPATSKTIAEQINRMLGDTYGWGGILGYRDCASTLHDLFTPFAIWLWGNSAEQAMQGEVIKLTGLSGEEKQTLIQKKGIPFFTLLGMHGHIMLYAGNYHNKVVAFHNMWGVRTFDLFLGNGRNIVGKAVITSLQPGSEKLDVFSSLQNSLQTMSILIPKENIS